MIREMIFSVLVMALFAPCAMHICGRIVRWCWRGCCSSGCQNRMWRSAVCCAYRRRVRWFMACTTSGQSDRLCMAYASFYVFTPTDDCCSENSP